MISGVIILFCFIVAAYFLVSATTMSVASWSAGQAFQASASLDPLHASSIGSAEFVIILPMLREQALVQHAIEQFIPLLRSGLSIRIVVATTERERLERNDALTFVRGATENAERVPWAAIAAHAVRLLGPETAAKLRENLPKLSNAEVFTFLERGARPVTADLAKKVAELVNTTENKKVVDVVEAPSSGFGKVAQMNFAVGFWLNESSHAERERTFFAVFDADSSPSFTAFTALMKDYNAATRAGVRSAVIYQQVSCYCQDLTQYKGLSGAMRVADAMAATRWAFGFEYPLYESYRRRISRAQLRPLIYCVGHGCFVNATFLQEIGGFPTNSPTDDLALGYLASVLGAEVAPLPALDYCGVPKTNLDAIRQSRFWYTGSAQFDDDLSYYIERYGKTLGRIQRFVLYINGHGRRLMWAWRGVLLLVALVASAAVGSWLAFTILLFSHVLYAQWGFLQTTWILKKLPEARHRSNIDEIPLSIKLIACLFATPAFFLRGLGPISAELMRALGKKRITSLKLER